jgi:hypothetical protein
MKSTLFIFAAFGCLLVDSMHLVADGMAADDPPVRLAVDLVDGSRVIGTSRNDSIRIHAVFGDTRISLRVVDHVRWAQDREHVVLEFPGGDRLTGVITPEIMHLNTLFGDAKVSMEHILMLTTIPAGMDSIPALDGLVLHFPFDEEPESDIVTSRVGQLQGKLRGGRWIRQGQRGGAFHFTKGDDGIVIADHESLRPRKLTLSAWVNPDADAHSSTWRGIVTKATPGNWTSGFGLSRFPSSPDAHFFVNYYSSTTAHAPIPDNTWTHLAATYDEKLLTLYINGVKAAAVVPQSEYGGAIQHGKSPLLIGQGPNGYGWFGKIDDVMLFNRVLSADDVSRLHQLTKGR